MTIILLIVCCRVLPMKMFIINEFESSLKSCLRFENFKHLEQHECEFVLGTTTFLCQYRCDTHGKIKLTDCQLYNNKSSNPPCEDLYCKAGPKVFYNDDQCLLINGWDNDLLCSYVCDNFNSIRLIECNSKRIQSDVPLCKDLYCNDEQIPQPMTLKEPGLQR